jgi:hypothetical protein
MAIDTLVTLDSTIVAMMKAWDNHNYYSNEQKRSSLHCLIIDIVNGTRSDDVNYWTNKITSKSGESQ